MSLYDNKYGEFAKVIPINPGTNVDMTKFATSMWLDSQHTRWDNSFPRKMGGYELIDYGTPVDLIKANSKNIAIKKAISIINKNQ